MITKKAREEWRSRPGDFNFTGFELDLMDNIDARDALLERARRAIRWFTHGPDNDWHPSPCDCEGCLTVDAIETMCHPIRVPTAE